MWAATDAVLTEYQGKWNSIVAFANAVNLFRKIKQEISPAANMQLQDNTGTTQSKLIHRTHLTDLCKQIALNIKAYAINTKDAALETQYNFTPTYFDKLRDNLLPVVAESIFNKAVELKEQLGDYGVDDEKLNELDEALTDYQHRNPAPRVVRGLVKQATSDISIKIKEGTLQLRQMDNLIGNFNKQHPDFVAAFNNARMVITLGSRSKKDLDQAPVNNSPVE